MNEQVDTSVDIDDEIQAQNTKAGIGENTDDSTIIDDTVDQNATNINDGGNDTTNTPPKTDLNNCPLATMLCGLHFAALTMAAPKAVKNITMEDFAYPEHLKPALEDALMKAMPQVMSNPWVIIGSTIAMHTFTMVSLSKSRENKA